MPSKEKNGVESKRGGLEITGAKIKLLGFACVVEARYLYISKLLDLTLLKTR